jgi:hypothetical protein
VLVEAVEVVVVVEVDDVDVDVCVTTVATSGLMNRTGFRGDSSDWVSGGLGRL